VLEDSFGTLIVAAVFLFAVLVVLAQTVPVEGLRCSSARSSG
jgi:hypothetical protein